MNKDEALRLALEALYGFIPYLPLEHDKPQCDRYDKAITAIKAALANEALDKMAENARELGLDYEPAQPFITHNVEQPYDWSEWVCPDPKGYLMKCCDCGLVHEAQFGVVRYKSETEREDCDMVDDPNLQAVFRMRRSEEWTPEDTAHRVGGLPMAEPEQDGECKHCTDGCPACDARKLPEQEPVAWGVFEGNLHDMFFSQEEAQEMADLKGTHAEVRPLYTTPPQRTWVGLTYEEESELIRLAHNHAGIRFYIQAAEAKLKDKNT